MRSFPNRTQIARKFAYFIEGLRGTKHERREETEMSVNDCILTNLDNPFPL